MLAPFFLSLQGTLTQPPKPSVLEGELFPPDPVSYLDKSLGPKVRNFLEKINNAEAYYSRLPTLTVEVETKELRNCSMLRKSRDGHFSLKPEDEVTTKLEDLKRKLDLASQSLLTEKIAKIDEIFSMPYNEDEYQFDNIEIEEEHKSSNIDNNELDELNADSELSAMSPWISPDFELNNKVKDGKIGSVDDKETYIIKIEWIKSVLDEILERVFTATITSRQDDNVAGTKELPLPPVYRRAGGQVSLQTPPKVEPPSASARVSQDPMSSHSYMVKSEAGSSGSTTATPIEIHSSPSTFFEEFMADLSPWLSPGFNPCKTSEGSDLMDLVTPSSNFGQSLKGEESGSAGETLVKDGGYMMDYEDSLIGEVLDEILQGVTTTARHEFLPAGSYEHPLEKSDNSLCTGTQTSEEETSSQASFVTIYPLLSRSTTPVDDLIIRELAKQRQDDSIRKSELIDHRGDHKIKSKETCSEDDISLKINIETNLPDAFERGIDECGALIDLHLRWIREELLYVPKTSKQFIVREEDEKGQSMAMMIIKKRNVILVQNWLLSRGQMIASLEQDHQVTVLSMPDSATAPHILLGPAAAVYLVPAAAPPQLAELLRSWHSATRHSCGQVWLLSLGDFSAFMETVAFCREAAAPPSMRPLLVPATSRLSSSLAQLAQLHSPANAPPAGDLCEQARLLQF